MYKFGKISTTRLKECDPKLQEILVEAIKLVDFSVLCGHRGRADQDMFFATGKSKLKFPHSNHNSMPSRAVDIAPFPIDWDNLNRFYHLAGIIRGIAHQKGIKIRFGGDWDNDGEITDNRFNDLPHIELL